MSATAEKTVPFPVLLQVRVQKNHNNEFDSHLILVSDQNLRVLERAAKVMRESLRRKT